MGKRPFSTNNNNNFSDYISNKKSVEIMKSIKSTNNNLNYFFSYNDFIQLAKTFFNYTNKYPFIMEPQSLFNSSDITSTYNDITSHIQNCSYCKHCNNASQLTNCSEIKNTLHLLKKNQINKGKGFYFPTNLNINNWCNNENVNKSDKSNMNSIPIHNNKNNLFSKSNVDKSNVDKSNMNNIPIHNNKNNPFGNSISISISNNLFPYFVDEDPNLVKDETIIIAFFSNMKEKITCKEYKINFKTIFLEFDYFQKLFYNSPLGNFYITESNHMNTILLLSTQLYLNTPFVLLNTLFKAYEELNFVSKNTLSMEKKILLEKEVASIHSLLDINEKQISMNWKEDIMPKLVNNTIIPTNNNNDTAYVTLTINIVYYCKVLNINLSMNTYYKIGIEGYVNNFDGWKKTNILLENNNIQVENNNIQVENNNIQVEKPTIKKVKVMNNSKNNLCGNYDLCKNFS